MKITINRGEDYPTITIDLDTLKYPNDIRNTLALAMELDGYTKETINDVLKLCVDKTS